MDRSREGLGWRPRIASRLDTQDLERLVSGFKAQTNWCGEDSAFEQHFIEVPLGKVKLAPGKLTVTLRPLTKPGTAVMNLRQIWLERMDSTE